MEPLSRYLQAGREGAPETAVAHADRDASRDDTRVAQARLYPTLSATGSYTRNQYNIAVTFPDPAGGMRTATFLPHNQLDATFAVDLPLLDLAAIRRLQAARADEVASTARIDTTASDLTDRICAAYTGVVAYEALSVSAANSIEAAEENLKVVTGRSDAGLASKLDVQRAAAQVDAARQVQADAALERRSAARRLEALTGLPVEAPVPVLDDDLHPEAPLDSWLGGVEDLPDARLARAQIRAAQANQRASRAGLMPMLSARAQERITNAAGFSKQAQWAVGITLTARFEVGAIHQARADRSRLRSSRARLEQTLRDQRLDIEDAHDRVASALVKAEAARSEARSTRAALDVARSRYEGGTASQLEVVQALRDDFAAEATRIQADADLAYARMRLRLAAGEPVEGS